MSRFLDVQPSDWYYNEIVEASNLIMEDGELFVEGIPYNYFEPNKPYVYKEFKAEEGQTKFTLPVGVTPTGDNPLFVWVEDVQTVYKSVRNNGSTTEVELYTPTRTGGSVVIASYGVPKVNEFRKPVTANLTNLRYPNAKLVGVHNYVYRPFQRDKQEKVVVLGRELRRANIPDEEWENNPNDRQAILRKYMGHKDDRYYIAKDAVLHLPFNLNNVSARVTYLTDEGGWYKSNTRTVYCTSPNVLFTNRVFPRAYITRAEVFTLIDRLRRTLFSRFTDTEAATHNMYKIQKSYLGQKVISTGGRYRMGQNELKVVVDEWRLWEGVDYVEKDEYSIELFKPLWGDKTIIIEFMRRDSEVLYDVGRTTWQLREDTGHKQIIKGTVEPDGTPNAWWVPHVLGLEHEMYNGKPIVQGIPIGEFSNDTVVIGSNMNPVNQQAGGTQWFMPNSFMTRAQAVTALNRFRKTMIERLI